MTDSSNNSYPSADEIEEFCHAARDGKIDTVRSYLDRFGAAIINAPDLINARAITWAAQRGHMDVVALLLENKADINAPGTNEKPALFWAVEENRLEITAFLLKKGALTNVCDDLGRTPLQIAQQRGVTELVEMIENHIKGKDEELRRYKEAQFKILRQFKPPKL